MPTLSKISALYSGRLTFCLSLLLILMTSQAQVCSDPANTVYGLTNSGYIHAINVNTGIVGPAINPAYPGNVPDQSNGIAYNALNGKFYYFKRIPSSSPVEFVSFDPATNTYQMLASPATSSSVYSGSITSDGDGYYMWNTQGRLFYYKISTNTWTTITSSLVDQYGKDVDSIIRAHGSGDGVIDGNGNLWILPSSNTRYGLFRLSFPLPTTPQASVTVQEMVAMQPPPSKFVGISFTISGEIFMITSSDKLYRLEDDLSLTLMSNVTLAMGDLTSCNFPLAVLAAGDMNFKTSLQNEKVNLSWLPSLQGAAEYFVERSADNRVWHTIAKDDDLKFSAGRIGFVDPAPLPGKNYYRVRVQRQGGRKTYSAVKMISVEKVKRIAVWPNPVQSELFIQGFDEQGYVTVYSELGNEILFVKLARGLNKIDVRRLPPGNYYISLRSESGRKSVHKIIRR